MSALYNKIRRLEVPPLLKAAGCEHRHLEALYLIDGDSPIDEAYSEELRHLAALELICLRGLHPRLTALGEHVTYKLLHTALLELPQ